MTPTIETIAADPRYRLHHTASRRLDSAALKRDHAELYSQYSRETVSKRFTLA